MKKTLSIESAVDLLVSEHIDENSGDLRDFNVDGMNYHELKSLMIGRIVALTSNREMSAEELGLKILAALSFLSMQNFVLEYKLEEQKNALCNM